MLSLIDMTFVCLVSLKFAILTVNLSAGTDLGIVTLNPARGETDIGDYTLINKDEILMYFGFPHHCSGAIEGTSFVAT